MPRMSQILSFVTLLALVILLGVLFYKVMVVFLVPLFLAVLMVIVFRPLHRRICTATGERPKLAAMLTTLAILLIVLVPLALVITFAAFEGISMASAFDTQKVKNRVINLRHQWGLELPLHDRQQRISGQFDRLLRSALSTESLTTFEAEKDQQVIASLARELASLETILQRQADQIPTDDTTAGVPPATDAPPSDKPAAENKTNAAPDTPAASDSPASDSPASDSAGEDLDNDDPDDPASDTPDAPVPPPEEEPILEDLPTPAAAKAALASLPMVRQLISQLEREGLTRGDPGYLSTVQQAQLVYQQIRESLVGGAVRLWLADLFNPSSDYVSRLRSRSVEDGQSWLLAASSTASGIVGGVVMGMVIMVLALYFFLVDGPDMVQTVMKLAPLDDHYELQLLDQFERISRAVVGATLLSAIAQAGLAGVGYYMAGVESVFLLTLLTGMLAFVPFLGAAGVWVPVCLWLLVFEDRLTAAILLALYGTFVVSLADNVIKPLVLHGQSKLHPLVALLSILGGIQALGPIGVLIGPMGAGLLQAGLNMLRTEVESFRTREEPEKTTATDETPATESAPAKASETAPAESSPPATPAKPATGQPSAGKSTGKRSRKRRGK